jgi:vacuolar protein sorting-associated protein 29
MLVLLIGDSYIPFNASDLPLKFRKLLTPGKISKILCTGNLNLTTTVEYLKTICSDISFVGGEFDDVPVTTQIVQLNNLKFGLVSGYSMLPWNNDKIWEMKARETDADVLISGFGNGFWAKEIDGRFYVNPGSCTGSYFHVISYHSLIN